MIDLLIPCYNEDSNVKTLVEQWKTIVNTYGSIALSKNPLAGGHISKPGRRQETDSPSNQVKLPKATAPEPNKI